MQVPLLSLGLFIFATGQTAIDEIQRKTSYRYGTGNAIGVLPTLQFLGQDNDRMVLPGVLYPEITDHPIVLDELRSMAKTGQSYALLGGDGTYFGLWKITDIEETRKYFLTDGTPRKIEFSLSLKLQDDRQRDDVAILQQQILDQLNGVNDEPV
ncbi:MAG: phage tail protein [Pseudomonadota bacterium]|nr:phage tail protein [Pseudomonadota bacterium]